MNSSSLSLSNAFLRRLIFFLEATSHFLITSPYVPTKGQLISKCLLGNSPKKLMNGFNFTTMVPEVELLSFVFWEN